MIPATEEVFAEKDAIIRLYKHPDDYLDARHVWESAGKGIHITFSDDIDEIGKLVERSPGLFFVAEMDGQIVGTVMGGFDGRRGLIYHLAVLPEYRHHKIGTSLMNKVEGELNRTGCTKVYLFILPDNLELVDFYKNLDYEQMAVIPFTKYLNKDSNHL